MTEQTYNMYGLLHDLLLVTTHKVEHMPAVVSALDFLKAGRNEFEANQPKAEETTETGSDSKDTGSDSTNKVRKTKQRKSK